MRNSEFEELLQVSKDLALVAQGYRNQLVKIDGILREIMIGAGAYSKDPLTHAQNVITQNIELARQALRIIEGP